jgi:hypothetical protein
MKTNSEKYKRNFNRCVDKTGKWRGKKPSEYVKVKSGKKKREKLMPGQPEYL